MISREEARAKLKPTFVEKDVPSFGLLKIRKLSWRAALKVSEVRKSGDADAEAKWVATWIAATVYGVEGLPLYSDADVDALIEADSDILGPLWRAVADVNVLDQEAQDAVGEASAATS